MPESRPISRDPVRIEVCKDADDLARHVATLFVNQAGLALGAGGRFTVALSGGETPRRCYSLLPRENYSFQIVWPAVHLFWCDERCVPPDHPDSNYGMAREHLLSRISIPEANVHRMRGEGNDSLESARSYEAEIRAHFGGDPRFDLVLLGMGGDGHTASLFPGTPALDARDSLVTAGESPDGRKRLTLTLGAINAARLVAVLVSGKDKAGMVKRVLGAGGGAEGLPIQRVRPADGQLLWLLDAEASSLLEPPSDS